MAGAEGFEKPQLWFVFFLSSWNEINDLYKCKGTLTNYRHPFTCEAASFVECRV